MDKSYKDIGELPLEYQDETLLDHVVELVGRFTKRSAIHAKLQETFPKISFVVTSVLISRARMKLRQVLKKDPDEFKGCIFEILMQMISGPAKNKDRLKAVEMLAIYSGAAESPGEDPRDYAHRIVEAMKEMDESVGGAEAVEADRLAREKENNDGPSSKTEGSSQTGQEGAEEEPKEPTSS